MSQNETYKPQTAILISPEGARCAPQNYAAYEAGRIICASIAEQQAIEQEFERLRDMCERCRRKDPIQISEASIAVNEDEASFCGVPSSNSDESLKCAHPDPTLFATRWKNWEFEQSSVTEGSV